ncbi:MAG: nitroreductase family protein [Clostridia bacterium]|nr:nitroreductase family protein [Clostridia bacterium]
MNNIEKLVRARRSVRTFDGRDVKKEDREKLYAFMENIENPYGLPVEFRLLEKMGCPVVVGTELYVGAKMKDALHINEAVGFAFEKLVLYAQSLGIGTVWIGGTMDRAAFEKKMELAEDEVMPAVSPLGYPANKMSVRETMMRKGIKADDRLGFESIVYWNDFTQPLTPDAAGKLFLPLEMVCLAPSAVNKQPWRMVVTDDVVHFYLQRSKGFGGGKLDMQKIDLGIALCHFDLMAKELGIQTEFALSEPDISHPDGTEYIASYKFKL